MDGKSLDPAADKIEKLKQLFPEVFSEGKIDMERMKATLGENIEFANERYVLNWAGKSDAFRTLQAPTTATLVPDRDESVDFDNTGNVFIEGENLEVLKVLQKSYYNKVKMIYIDPPYNTGNDNFIYPDKFSESKKEYMKRIGDKDEEGFLMKEGLFRKNSKDSGHYHSNWLSMMYPRLFLARNLLKDDGVIFVSIDDNEVHNLRLLMNEIFGEENFVANVIWEKKFSPQNDAKWFSDNHDHILVYARDKENWRPIKLPRTKMTDARYKNPDNDPRGLWASSDMTVKSYNVAYDYPLTTLNGNIVNPTKGRCWAFPKEKFEELVKDNRVWFGKDGMNTPRYKSFLSEMGDGIVPLTIWKHSDVGHNQEARQEIKKLFVDNAYFDGPKPKRLLRRINMLSTTDSDIILDFFSGSATAAHAVLDLNKEDGGNRKFIMVQLPEKTDEKSEAFKAGYKTIADIGKERIRRVIKKIAEERTAKEKEQENKLIKDEEQKKQDLGFKVFKLRPSNFKIWRSDLIETEEDLQTQITEFIDPVKPGSKEENMLFELLIKSGKDLNCEIVRKESGGSHYFMINKNEAAIALDAINQEMITEIISQSPANLICLDRLFEDNDQLKTNTALQLKDAGVGFKSV